MIRTVGRPNNIIRYTWSKDGKDLNESDKYVSRGHSLMIKVYSVFHKVVYAIFYLVWCCWCCCYYMWLYCFYSTNLWFSSLLSTSWNIEPCSLLYECCIPVYLINGKSFISVNIETTNRYRNYAFFRCDTLLVNNASTIMSNSADAIPCLSCMYTYIYIL